VAIRVLLVNAQPLVREGIKYGLRAEPDIEIAGEAGTDQDAVAAAARLRPDVVLIDVRLPDRDGIKTIRAIKQQCPKTEVLVVTPVDAYQSFQEAARAGAVGYVLDDIAPVHLASAIRGVREGKAALSPSIARQLVNYLSTTGGSPTPLSRFHGLTQRDVDVLRLVAQGLSDKEIAGRLSVSAATVKTHLRAIYRKLGIRNRAQAVAFALEKGVLSGTHVAPGRDS